MVHGKTGGREQSVKGESVMKFVMQHQKKIILLLFVAWTGGILFLSGQNGDEAFGLTYRLACPIAGIFFDHPDYDQILAVMIVMRKLGRCFFFLFFGFLWYLLVEVFAKEWNVIRKRIVILSGMVLFSVFDETHKLFIAGRHCTMEEIFINIVCGTIGILIAFSVGKKWHK